ncbi:orotidine-5'-phosphate decarboxylase [Microbacterium sp. B35-04]|uniref:orotidine-5'-phosphate decarboxylase n=1 Tax=unclassified Microbacterium TaxID=2609290 RepID=UPI0013D058E3|nr:MULTISPECIES: orotidine-5'-phosphate decarboxylase [unclassified Microbacterium]KAF2411893.1 orotidine-5'-phosphate decarboxylase [Microbacterium sp. B35-04]KAF2419133.1 orotidine-5'-phosphate decarboxylase [Microbacterium sp. B35-30]
MTSFGERVRAATATHGQLCVGIDPHAHLLAEWGMDASAAGAREFGLRVVDAAAGRVGVVKPQVSFFERYGSAGFAALETVMAAARAAGLLVIADAKRGDIGTTMDAYAEAWLTPGSPLEADAVTANPFLGVGALEGTFVIAERHGKGVFVLAATSNPDAFTAQRAVLPSSETVSAAIMREISERNAGTTPDGQWASLGVVVGATVDWTDAGLRVFSPVAPILAPGFGHQGAEPHDLRARFGDLAEAVIASESRSILAAGPDRLAARISERALLYRGD